jgi:hypothetical protein
MALGIDVQLGKLTESVGRIETLAKTADEAAKEAAKVAREANTRSSTTNTSAKKANNGLQLLYTKNLTLKH